MKILDIAVFFCLLILCLLIFVPIIGPKTFAAPNNLEIETLHFEVPNNSYPGAFIDFELSGGDLPQTYKIGYYWYEKNCGVQIGITATCSDKISVPEIFNQQLGTNITLSGAQTYKLKINGAYHLLNNKPTSFDGNGSVECMEDNCRKLFAGHPFQIGSTIGTTKMKWTVKDIEPPRVEINPREVSSGQTAKVTIKNMKRGLFYTVYFQKNRQSGGINFGTADINITDNCRFELPVSLGGIGPIGGTRDGRNSLNATCKQSSGSDTYELEFNVPVAAHPLPASNLDEEYYILVSGGLYNDSGIKSFNEIAEPIIFSTKNKATDFTVKVLNPANGSLPALTNQKVTVQIQNTTPGKVYKITLGTSSPLRDVQLDPVTATGNQVDIGYDTVMRGYYLYQSAGKYNISVREEGSNKAGQTTIDVTAPPAGSNPQNAKLACKLKTDQTLSPGDKVCTSAAGQPCNPDDPTKPGTGGIETALGCVPTDPKAFLEKSLPVVFGASGGVAFLLMIMGAFQMITSAGNPDSVKKGREQFNSAIIGLLFILFSVLLLQVVGFNILNIPGFGK